MNTPVQDRLVGAMQDFEKTGANATRMRMSAADFRALTEEQIEMRKQQEGRALFNKGEYRWSAEQERRNMEKFIAGSEGAGLYTFNSLMVEIADVAAPEFLV